MNPDKLQHLLLAAAKSRLLVVGDVMLDEFVWGRVSRISPEAPVPVVEVVKESSYPGGAANVARNLRPFCAGVHLCGLVGEDVYAAQLRNLLDADRISTDSLVSDPGTLTIVKTRIVARQQQVVRVDREKRPAGGKVITADPKPGNPIDWQGVDLLKPNRSEAFAMAGRKDHGAADDPLKDESLIAVGSCLLAKWDLPGLLITLGEHGMILFERGKTPYHTPTRAREVFDVSGAGDTAIALYTLALCAGATPREAAEISNHASGVVVAKLGTATLTSDELLASFSEHFG